MVVTLPIVAVLVMTFYGRDIACHGVGGCDIACHGIAGRCV